MGEELTVINERVDDTPVLIAQMDRMGVQSTLDEHFPTHGNWRGVSLGCVAETWLAHILSEGDHRLNRVQEWVSKRLQTLSACTQRAVRELDFSDDRLEGVLRALSDDERWRGFEAAFNRRLVRVYDLRPGRVRLDSTSASGYWSVTEEGLFQFGHSKDHRPGSPQVKVMLSTLDPLGMPVAVQVVSGERADDPLYVPAVVEVRKGLGQGGLLYIGDCKMGALETRAFLQAGGDYYLCPLSLKQLSQTELEGYLQPVWDGKQALTQIERQKEDGAVEQIAEGYERGESLTATVEGKTVTWTERRLVIRSLLLCRAAEAGLQRRLKKAQEALEALTPNKRGKAPFRELGPLRQKVESILARYEVADLLRIDYQEIVQERALRRYGSRPEGRGVDRKFQLRVTVDETALAKAVRCLGWRVYATTQPTEQLPLDQAVLAYREEYLIERGMGRLKGRPLSLIPMYLQDDDHVTGLIRLLSIALRVLTLLEYTARRRLAAEQGKLAGLYAGNPKRSTARPTAEALLEALKEITLSVVTLGRHTQRHVTALSTLQQRVLKLLDLSPSIYSVLAADSSGPP